MSGAAKLSVVLPVHDGQDRIAAEVGRVLEAVLAMVSEAVEILIVDDGSRDGTAEVLSSLAVRYPQVRIARHSRRLGMEAAGQTGLERAIGDLVFIQEDDSPLRLADLRHLYKISSDEAVVAARAQQGASSRQPLLRRLRAWGASTSQMLSQIREDTPPLREPVPGLQMVRRAHLQQLAPTQRSFSRPNRWRLSAERITVPSIA